MMSTPKATSDHSAITSLPFGAKANKRAKPTARFRKPQTTFTKGEDSPTPGGEAKGV